MYHVGKFDESKFAVPRGYEHHAQGYERVTLVDHSIGSVQTGLGICQLQPKGRVESCFQANEKGIYVLQGELELRRGKEGFRLAADDYALIPYGIPHAFRNTGNQAVRWLEVQAPQPKPPDVWQDTCFLGDADWPREMIKPDFADPRTRLLGHFERQRPLSIEGLGLKGLTVYRFMDQEFGAQHLLMMRGEMAPGGTCGLHDHTFEESYLVLTGEVDMEIEGKTYRLRPGDMAWTGTGTRHAFYQKGDASWRWIETKAPQVMAPTGTRHFAIWNSLRGSSS